MSGKGLSGADEEILQLVRAGVEKFIMNTTTIEEFMRLIRSAGEHEASYTHPLTKAVLARIVKTAMKERTKRHGR